MCPFEDHILWVSAIVFVNNSSIRAVREISSERKKKSASYDWSVVP